MELLIIGAIYIAYKLIKEATEKPLPPEYHNNHKLEAEDANKVRFGQMSQKEFRQNIKNGKYR